MGKLTLTTFLTLDGVMQAPGGPDEDTSGGFAYGGWQFPFADQDMGAYMGEVFERSGAFLFGRRTFDTFAAFWPTVTDPANPAHALAERFNTLPKYVASRTLKEPEWAGTTVLDGELPVEITKIKERTEGEVQVHGSGQLAQFLLARDLVDELNLLIHPVFLGQGRRLFPSGGLPTACELTDSRTTASGIAIHTFRPTGRATFGTMGG
ncbi:dihydrofolate reductase family protein [Streptomyces bambusae]|uniref:dihydrofolate reductase family protein n=1 Tax=Streptomyces bambusae TaxID=1550616 RepID=UPI001CFFAD86|nr:dihydrofolate reductase family protein [Streptomyces bambusae]MCB5169527.1 dihydrofolate reductase family protein [Streptomyces bambusae]